MVALIYYYLHEHYVNSLVDMLFQRHNYIKQNLIKPVTQHVDQRRELLLSREKTLPDSSTNSKKISLISCIEFRLVIPKSVFSLTQSSKNVDQRPETRNCLFAISSELFLLTRNEFFTDKYEC